jgi:hypothetical protein
MTSQAKSGEHGQVETREQRFKRIAEKRTNDIIRRIRLLGNCSNRSSYDYTDQQVSKIFAAVDKEVKEARARFTYTRRKEFKL